MPTEYKLPAFGVHETWNELDAWNDFCGDKYSRCKRDPEKVYLRAASPNPHPLALPVTLHRQEESASTSTRSTASSPFLSQMEGEVAVPEPQTPSPDLIPACNEWGFFTHYLAHPPAGEPESAPGAPLPDEGGSVTYSSGSPMVPEVPPAAPPNPVVLARAISPDHLEQPEGSLAAMAHFNTALLQMYPQLGAHAVFVAGGSVVAHSALPWGVHLAPIWTHDSWLLPDGQRYVETQMKFLQGVHGEGCRPWE